MKNAAFAPFIDRQRKKDSRWDDFQLLGWWEIDRMSFGDFESCGRNTRLALDALGFPLMEAPDKTIWRPHLHAIIRKGGLTTEEIASALRKETHTAKYQVDIQPFRAYRDVKENIQSIVRYCLKFRIECDYKVPDAQDFIGQEQADEAKATERNWWPAEDIRQYVDWLCVERSGFQSLRVVIGQAKGNSTNNVQRAVSSDASIAEEIEDGDVSVKPMSDRSAAHAIIDKTKAHAVVLNMDRTFVVEDSRVISGNSVTRCVYNNIIQDTNWTDIDVDSLLPGSNLTAATAISGTSRYAGNVINLSERLRSIMTLKQASGVQRGGTMQP